MPKQTMEAQRKGKATHEEGQKLSLSQAAAFDWKRKQGKTWRNTAWHELSAARNKAGISRSLKVRARKAQATA